MGWWLNWDVNIILFIDSGKTSLKAVLLHNDNIKPSIPVGYSILRKEIYHTMKILLDLREYPKYNWKIYSDLKVVSLLLELQLGYTKYVCFLCLWNSWQDSSHYAVKVWPPRQSSQIGRQCPTPAFGWLCICLFTASWYQAWFNEKFCESDGPEWRWLQISQRFLWSFKS